MIAGKNTRLTNSAFSETTKAVACIFWFCACCSAKRSEKITTGVLSSQSRAKAKATHDLGYVYTGPDRNQSETDSNGSKTGPAVLQVQFWIRLDSFRTGPRRVPCKQKAYPVWFSDRMHLDPFGTRHAFSCALKRLLQHRISCPLLFAYVVARWDHLGFGFTKNILTRTCKNDAVNRRGLFRERYSML